MGWFGSAYLLTFGLTYPVVCRLFALLSDLYSVGAVLILHFAFVTIFGVGSLFSYRMLSAQGVLIGRVLSGLGAAGLAPGPSTVKSVRGIGFSVYAIGRFLGPL
jgi:hypothetical protein